MKANDGVMSLDIWFLVNFFLFSIAATVLRLHPSIPPSAPIYSREKFLSPGIHSRREYTDARTSLLLELCQVRLTQISSAKQPPNE